MTTDYHDAHAFAAPLTSAEINGPLGTLDQQLGVVSTRVFDVRELGATGDGTTDDWAAIQATLDAVTVGFSGTGGVVLFPPGNYRISQPLWVKSRGTTLRGAAGAYASTIQPTAGFAIGSAPELAAVIVRMTDGGLPYGIGIENMTVRMNGVSGGGIIFYHHNVSHMTDVWVNGVADTYNAIRVKVDPDLVTAGNTDVSETNVWTNVTASYNAVNATGTLVRLDRCQEMTLIGCKFVATATGSTTQTSKALYIDTPRGVTLIGCSTAGAGEGIRIENNHTTGSTTVGYVNIFGHTWENIIANTLIAKGVTGLLRDVNLHAARYLTIGVSAIDLQDLQRSNIDTQNTPVTLDAQCVNNIIHTRSASTVTDSGPSNTVIAIDTARQTLAGVTYARQMQTVRAVTASLAAGASEDLTLTWPVAWPSTNYSFSLVGRNTSSATATIHVQGLTKAAGNVVARVKNNDAVARAITVEAISILD